MKFLFSLTALLFLAATARAQSLPTVDHWQARLAIVTLQAPQIGSGCVLRYGDSLQEEMSMPTFQLLSGGCGTIINAGMMGARLSDLTADFPYVLSVSRPSVIIVSGGTNDAILANDTPAFIATWAQSFNLLLSQADGAGASQIIVETITPIRPSAFVSQPLIDKLNAQIMAVAANHPAARVLDLVPYFRCSDGYAGAQFMGDALHLGVLGAWYKYWYEEILLSGQTLPVPAPGC